MPQNIHRGIKALIDEANAEIETIEAADAIQILNSDDVVIVDIRDPREIEREGRIPGAFSCTRGMLEFWIDPASPYAKPIFQQEKKFIFHCAGGMRSALGGENRAGHGIEAGRAYGRRFCRMARRRRSGREVGAEEEGLIFLRHSGARASANPESRADNFWILGSAPVGASRNDEQGFGTMTTADDPLVSTDWLAARLDDAKVKIIDASYKMPGVLPLPSEDYLGRAYSGRGVLRRQRDRRSRRSAAAYVSEAPSSSRATSPRSAFPPVIPWSPMIPAAGSQRPGRGGCSCRSAIAM